MGIKQRRFASFCLAGAFLLPVLSSCDAGNSVGATAGGNAGAAGESKGAALDPLLVSPLVGDIWAGELTAFPQAEFADGSAADPKAYGLLKIVEVTPETLTVITESAAWARQQGAIDDLQGNLRSIKWDESARIAIPRASLGQMVAEGKILRTRRIAVVADADAEAAPAEADAAKAEEREGADAGE